MAVMAVRALMDELAVVAVIGGGEQAFPLRGVVSGVKIYRSKISSLDKNSRSPHVLKRGDDRQNVPK